MDCRPRSPVDPGSIFGFCRAINAGYLGGALRHVLEMESLSADGFQWCVNTVKTAVHHVRELCDEEADNLYREKNFWWRQGA